MHLHLIPIALLCVAALVSAEAPAAAQPTSPAGLTVGAVLAAPAANLGRITVAGTVSRVFAERRAFIISDAADCTACASCGPTPGIPILVPAAEYSGELPAVGQAVAVTGDLEAKDRGYQFVVAQVTRDGQVVQAKKVN